MAPHRAPHRRLLRLCGLAAVIALSGLAVVAPPALAGSGPADGGRVHVLRGSESRLGLLPSFHVRLGPARRADCILDNGSPPQVELRCDRYARVAGQELTVHLVHGHASRVPDPSDATGDPVGPRLRAGHSWQVGRIACRATAASVRCHDRHTGHGFRMRAHHLRLF